MIRRRAGGADAASTLAIVFVEASEAAPIVAGVTVLERLLRTLARAGVTDAVLVSSVPEALAAALAEDPRARLGIAITRGARAAGEPQVEDLLASWPESAERALVLPAPALLDLRAIKVLVRSPGSTVLVDPSAGGESRLGPAFVARAVLEHARGALAPLLRAAVARGTVAVLDVQAIPAYIPSMRRVLRPYWLDSPSTETARRHAEDVIVEAAQKKVLDLPAYVHAPIENAVVRGLCRTRLTPNQVSLLGNVVAWIATGLFAWGQLGWGIALALAVGVLDGVDGKLARVKVETSAAGKLEHWFDTLFEVSWAVALAFHLARSAVRPDAWWLLLLLLGAEALDGLAKGAIILSHGRQIDDVAPLDRAIRLVGGRRNVYVWIMTAGIVTGRAGDAFALVAWWEAATAAVHLARAAWLLLRRRPVAGAGGA